MHDSASHSQIPSCVSRKHSPKPLRADSRSGGRLRRAGAEKTEAEGSRLQPLRAKSLALRCWRPVSCSASVWKPGGVGTPAKVETNSSAILKQVGGGRKLWAAESGTREWRAKTKSNYALKTLRPCTRNSRGSALGPSTAAEAAPTK